MNTEILIPILIALGVLLLGVIAIFIVKKIGQNFVNVAKRVVEFVYSTLKDIGISSDKIDLIVDLILRGLTYVQSISKSTTPFEEKVSAACLFIDRLLNEAGLTITEEEKGFIETVIRGGFQVMDMLGLDAKAVTVSNYVKLYKKTTKVAKLKSIKNRA